MGLAEYNRKRNFQITSEPSGDAAGQTARGRCAVVRHPEARATRLHYDFRLELDGVLLSLVGPQGPQLDPAVKRLAMHVEDHPLAYGDFEGIIPKGQYGGGTVLLWDHGTWEPQEDPVKGYAAGNLKFILKGEKLSGGFALIRLGGRRAREEGEKAWLLIKEKDAHAHAGGPEPTDTQQNSVTTGRTMERDRRGPLARVAFEAVARRHQGCAGRASGAAARQAEAAARCGAGQAARRGRLAARDGDPAACACWRATSAARSSCSPTRARRCPRRRPARTGRSATPSACCRPRRCWSTASSRRSRRTAASWATSCSTSPTSTAAT